MDLKAVDQNEMRDRAKVILDRIDSLLREIGPKILEIGRLRAEIEMIVQELKTRGVLKESEVDAK